jgi:GNAT superfamily N-acetyltransferase
MIANRIESLNESQVEDLHRLYQNEWWSRDRTLDATRRMLAAAEIFIALGDESGRLAAFARVLSDYVFKAFIFDVMVVPEHRGSGLGAALMDSILGHPRLARVEHFELYCRPDLVSFYERWRFFEVSPDLRLLRRARQRPSS